MLSNLNTVLDRLYIGDLSAAQRPPPYITHILSVCPDLPSLPPSVAQPRSSSSKYQSSPPIQHLCIPIQDTEHTDIIPHLRSACSFIRAALREDERNQVLVHCVMGISRSATVICAFLMMTQGWDVRTALSYLRTRRPQVHPNYGFMRQLDIFAQCGFNPSPTNPAYVQWTRKRKREVNKFLSRIQDVVGVLDDRVYMCEELPSDPRENELFLDELEVKHSITICSSSSSSSSSQYRSSTRPTLPLSPPSSSSSLSSHFTDSAPSPSPRTNRSFALSLLPPTTCTPVPKLCAKSQAHGILPTPEPSPKSSPTASPTTLGHGRTSRNPQQAGIGGVMTVEVDAFVRSLWPVLRDLDRAVGGGGKGMSRRGSRAGLAANEDGAGVNGKVLIQCSQEMSACVVVCSYIMWKSALSPSAAFAKLEDSLPLFNPTSTFFAHLGVFYEALQVNPNLILNCVPPSLSPSSSSSSSSYPPSPGDDDDVSVEDGDSKDGQGLLGMSRLSLDERAAGLVGAGALSAGSGIRNGLVLRRGLRTVEVGAV